MFGRQLFCLPVTRKGSVGKIKYQNKALDKIFVSLSYPMRLLCNENVDTLKTIGLGASF